jgi:hypothetical protein
VRGAKCYQIPTSATPAAAFAGAAYPQQQQAATWQYRTDKEGTLVLQFRRPDVFNIFLPASLFNHAPD